MEKFFVVMQCNHWSVLRASVECAKESYPDLSAYRLGDKYVFVGDAKRTKELFSDNSVTQYVAVTRRPMVTLRIKVVPRRFTAMQRYLEQQPPGVSFTVSENDDLDDVFSIEAEVDLMCELLAWMPHATQAIPDLSKIYPQI